MVYAYHVIFSTYGFWLPNEPRGSWSDFVGSWELFRYGPATKTTSRRSVAQKPHDRALRLAAKQALKYPPVKFTGVQARAVAIGFAAFAAQARLNIWACAILPDHVHMVIARHSYRIEQVMNLLKGSATTQLLEERLHPMLAYTKPDGSVPHCWGGPGWKVYLDSERDILLAIPYVAGNPLKEGKRRQDWSFVKPFPGLIGL